MSFNATNEVIAVIDGAIVSSTLIAASVIGGFWEKNEFTRQL